MNYFNYLKSYKDIFLYSKKIFTALNSQKKIIELNDFFFRKNIFTNKKGLKNNSDFF